MELGGLPKRPATLGYAYAYFRYLDRAIDTREAAVLTVATEPLWDGLRSEPRFARVLERTGNGRR